MPKNFRFAKIFACVNLMRFLNIFSKNNVPERITIFGPQKIV